MQLLVILLCSILFFSCGKSRNLPEQVMRINICVDPMTLDPRRTRSLESVSVCRMLFEGLTRISKQGIPELALAEAVEISEDGLEYKFHLRNTFWSNGDPVTSHDFAETWRLILDPQFPSDIAYQLYVIENAKEVKLGQKAPIQLGVITPNEQTLIVRLAQPIPYFLEICSTNSFFPVPRHIAKSDPNWMDNEYTFVGNGPFVLKTWKHHDEIYIEKNEKYWDAPNIQLHGVRLLMVSGATELQMFEDQQLDWAGSPISTLPVSAIQYLQTTNQLKVSPLAGTRFLRINTSEVIKNKPNILSRPEFRKALAYSIDREALVTHILQGGQIPARSLVPPIMGLYEEGYFDDHDLQYAQSLLKEALQSMKMQKKSLEPIILSFVNGFDVNAQIAQTIQEIWQKALGIPIELEALELKVFFERIKQKDYQLAIGSWIADFNDPINFLEVFKYSQGTTNNTFWENLKYIELLDRSIICRNQDERQQLLHEAEKILMDQMPLIPLYHYTMNFLQQNNVSGVALSPIGQIDVRWARIEMKE